MIEFSLSRKQVDLLFPALKLAETAYTDAGNFKACKELEKIYRELRKQIFTYGQI